MKTFLLSLVFLIAIVRCMSQQLECASCQEAPSVEECRLTTTLCGAGEQCFLEKVTTTQLKVAFNAGCRSATVCGIMASLNQGKRSVDFEEEEDEGKEKRARNLVNCAECCNTDPDPKFGPCNVQLCGLKTNASKPVCLVCPGFHSGSNFCSTKDTCQDTQVCHTGIVYINGGIRYTYGCEDRHRCEAFIKNVNATDSVNTGRRQDVGVHLCDACCTGNECNKADCFDLYKKMTLASLGIGNQPAQTNPPPATQPPVPITAQPATPKPTTVQPATPKPTTQAPKPTTQAASVPPSTQAPPPSTQAPPPSTQAPPPSGQPSVAPTAGR